jgi:arylsulfatase A-like enzyme
VVVDEAIRFIRGAATTGKPFFVVIWFGSPHEPYQALPSDLARYDDLPEKYSERTVTLTSNETGQPTQRPLRDVLQERYAEITAMDRALGNLRTWLEENSLRQNTLLWYCGDNGTPDDGIVTSPLRGHKSTMYEGGLRVPGIIEWPQGITHPRSSDLNTVTSDMLPTLCELASVALPDRPLDGISLRPLIEGAMSERPRPIGFWDYATGSITANPQPYIAPPLQEGTTPLVKMLEGRYTRNFQNFHKPDISDNDYHGTRVWLDNRYKLIVASQPGGQATKELYDVRNDPAEKQNVIAEKAEHAESMERQLLDWQRSVLHSLTGADYR